MKKIISTITIVLLSGLTTVHSAETELEKALKIGDEMRQTETWECRFAKNRTDDFKYDCVIPLMFNKIMSDSFSADYSAKNTEKLGGFHHSQFVRKIKSGNGSCPKNQVIKGIDNNGKIICENKIAELVEIEIIEGFAKIKDGAKEKNISASGSLKERKYSFYDKITIETERGKPATVRFVADKSILRLEGNTKIRLNTNNRDKEQTKEYGKIADILVYDGVIWGRVLQQIDIGNEEVVAGVRGTSFLWEQRSEGNIPEQKGNFFNSKKVDTTLIVTVFDSQYKNNAMTIKTDGKNFSLKPNSLNQPSSGTLNENLSCGLVDGQINCEKSSTNLNNIKSPITGQSYLETYREKTKSDIAYMNMLKYGLSNEEDEQLEKIKQELQASEKDEVCEKGEVLWKGMVRENEICQPKNIVYIIQNFYNDNATNNKPYQITENYIDENGKFGHKENIFVPSSKRDTTFPVFETYDFIGKGELTLLTGSENSYYLNRDNPLEIINLMFFKGDKGNLCKDSSPNDNCSDKNISGSGNLKLDNKAREKNLKYFIYKFIK